METACDWALVELGLKDRNDPLAESIAKLIVEVAQAGEKSSEAICALALGRLKGTDREA